MSKNELLSQAISSLAIADVFLMNCHNERKEGFLPPHCVDDMKVNTDTDREYEVQFRNTTKRHDVFNNTNGTPTKVIFQYETGFRLIDRENNDEKFKFEALFAAVYLIKGEISTDALKEFGQRNVGFNVWPYWRELASSMSNRFRIGDMMIPLYSINNNE